MTSHYGNQWERSMNGITNVDSDNLNSNNIVCDTFVSNISANVPTAVASDNSTSVANTSWVSNHVSNITLTLQECYNASSSLPQIAIDSTNSLQIRGNSGVSNIMEFQDSSGTTKLKIDKDGRIEGDANGSLYISPSIGPLGVINIANGTWVIGQNSSVADGDFYIPSRALTNKIDFNLPGSNLEIGDNSTGGKVVFLNYCPQTGIAPTSADDLVNKNYVDAHPHDNLLPTNNTWTGTNTFSNTVSMGTINAYNNNMHIGANQWVGDDIRLGNSASTVTCSAKLFSNIIDGSSVSSNVTLYNNLTSGSLDICSTPSLPSYSHTGDINIGVNQAPSTNFNISNPFYGTTRLQGDEVYISSSTGFVKAIAPSIQLDSSDEIIIDATNASISCRGLKIRSHLPGAYLVTNGGGSRLYHPIFYSIPDYANFTQQTNTGGASSLVSQSAGPVAGSWSVLNLSNQDDHYILLPNYGIIVYGMTSYGGVVRLDVKNTTPNPIIVKPSSTNDGQSCKLYFDDVQILRK